MGKLMGPLVSVKLKEDTEFKAGSGVMLVSLAVLLPLYGWMFAYVLGSTTGKDVPWYADGVAGLLLGSHLGKLFFLAVIGCWIVRLCGAPVPFFNVP